MVVHDFSALVSAELFASSIRRVTVDILFAMNNFHELGIQKVILTLCNSWDRNLGEIGLSVHNREGKFDKYVQDTYPLFILDTAFAPRLRFHFIARTIGYYRLLKRIKPKKVIAVNQAEALSLCIVKRFYKNFRLIVCEHCNITESIGDYTGWFGWYYRHFFQREYQKYADGIHTVSEESKDDMVQNWGFPAQKIKVIYNPAMIDEKMIPQKKNNNQFTIVAASRLTQQKRVDILLKGLSFFRRDYPDLFHQIHVDIYGEGDQKEELVKLKDQLSLSETVCFRGFLKDPWKQVATADLFVSTSEWEGLSVSLIEAQTVHTPILASDCPSGNKEILMNGKAGRLFQRNNPEDFSNQLAEIMQNREKRAQYVRMADENIHRFSLKTIMHQYAEI